MCFLYFDYSTLFHKCLFLGSNSLSRLSDDIRLECMVLGKEKRHPKPFACDARFDLID